MRSIVAIPMLLAGLVSVGGGVPARRLVGVCRGVDGPLAMVVSASSAPGADGHRAWSLRMTSIDGTGPREPVAGQALAPADLAFIPATAALSWRDGDDGASVLWAKGMSVFLAPRGPGETSGLTPLTASGPRGPCEGAALVTQGTLPDGGGIGAVLLITAEASAFAISEDGAVARMPLVGRLSAARKRPKKPVRAATDGGVERFVFERTDVRVEGGFHVGRAWRVMVLPGGAAGHLTSEAVALERIDGRRVRAVHHVTGALQLGGGYSDVEGVLLEPVRVP